LYAVKFWDFSAWILRVEVKAILLPVMELDIKVEKGLLRMLPLYVFVHSIALYDIQALIPQGR